MRDLLKKRERENLKFLMLCMLSAMLFVTCLLFPSVFNILKLSEGLDRIEAPIIMILCVILFFYSYLKLNYTKEITEDDLKAILEDKEYENIKPIFKDLKPSSVDNLTYDFFYKTIKIYDRTLINKNEEDENKTYKKNFLENLK